MAEAHVGLISDPSATGTPSCMPCHESDAWTSACEGCHQTEVAATATSLHTNLNGEIKAFEDRAGHSIDQGGFRDYFDRKCGECHTTCGQCHVSRPHSVGGGFMGLTGDKLTYSGHLFRPTPSNDQQCMACHGTRINFDFEGKGEGVSMDIHRQTGVGNKCEDCHTQLEIHGDGNTYEHRYAMEAIPRCENCHGPTHDDQWENDFHNAHVNGFAAGANLQCQVCHSQPYRNCTNCHNLADGFDIEEEEDVNGNPVLSLKIAKNTLPKSLRGYDYVLVRHAPISRGTYTDWGLPDLAEYSSRPTWQYASPHNIRRNTTQTAGTPSCSSACHRSDHFLKETDLYDELGAKLEDYDANLPYVIPAGVK